MTHTDTIYPAWWKGAGIDAKANHLILIGAARDFSHACSILAKRKPPARAAKVGVGSRARLPYADN